MNLNKFFLNKSINANLISNYGVTVSGSVLSMLFTPLYIYYLSIEAYGIIGFIASVTVFLNFLDLGMGQTVNREMARFHRDPVRVQYLNNLVYSLKIIYIGIGIFCAAIIVAGAPVLARSWFNAQHLDVRIITYSIIILGITIGCRWPYAFFAAAIRGMQYQVLLNSWEIWWNVIKAAGSIIVLKYFSATLVAFLSYQCVITLLQTLTAMIMCRRLMDKPVSKTYFDGAIITSLKGYIASMGVASILVAFIFQLDKIILSKTLKGDDYGYYILSNNLAATILIISTPVAITLFPHFTAFLHKKQMNELAESFHKYTKILSVTLLPVSLMLGFFTPQLLWIWTKDAGITSHATPLVRIILIGTLLDAYMVVPNTLLLADSRSKFILISHTIAIMLMVPVTYFLSLHFGAAGGAVSVAFILGGYFVFEAPFVFRFCLRGHYFKWLLNDILFIALPLAALVWLFKWLLPMDMITNRFYALVILGIAGMLLLLTAALLSGLPVFDKFLFWKKNPVAAIDNNK